jgi:hypothetical protein
MYLQPKLIFGCLILVLCFSCTEKLSTENKAEGVITYDVTFPFNQDDILVNVFPTEMIIEFDETHMHASLESRGGIIANEFIVDNATHELNQLLRSFNDRYAMHLDDQGVKNMLTIMPEMRLTPTDRTDTLAGYLCHITIAEFTTDSVPAIELWHTGELDIKNPNWWNQFFLCDQILLGYEVEQYGMRMKLRAKKVELKEVNDDNFNMPAGYESVDYEGMDGKIKALLEQYTSNDR